jgi:hypothetical protein
MLNWLKKVDPQTLSPLRKRNEGKRIVGFLGTRTKTSYDALQTEILEPVLAAWGIPDEVILPSEGDSSHIVMRWAQRKGIPIQLISSDWATHGKRASLLRDAHIQKMATHLVLLQGPRSNAYSTLAAKLTRKGRMVALSERPGEVLSLCTKINT